MRDPSCILQLDCAAQSTLHFLQNRPAWATIIKVVFRPLLLERMKERGAWGLFHKNKPLALYGSAFKKKYLGWEESGKFTRSRVDARTYLLFLLKNADQLVVDEADRCEYDALMNKREIHYACWKGSLI